MIGAFSRNTTYCYFHRSVKELWNKVTKGKHKKKKARTAKMACSVAKSFKQHRQEFKEKFVLHARKPEVIDDGWTSEYEIKW